MKERVGVGESEGCERGGMEEVREADGVVGRAEEVRGFQLILNKHYGLL